jgi:putative phosphoesterase
VRIAVVSDIHGNLTAFEAVLADLREMSPDLILHGGDLADSGSSPVEIVDHIRGLGWPGVMGNTDEMLVRLKFPPVPGLADVLREMAEASRAALGSERLDWLGALPLTQKHGSLALVHASPDDPWRSPANAASDDELRSVYGSLGRPVAVYGHIHHSFVRSTGSITVANSGSVSLSYDGDPRASYLLVNDAEPVIRRVPYDIDREVKALLSRGFPHAAWIARILLSGHPEMP